MNFDKESKSRLYFFSFWEVGGGGRGQGEDMNTRGAIFFIYKTHCHDLLKTSTELYSLMKLFLTVLKIEGIVALTIKGR